MSLNILSKAFSDDPKHFQDIVPLDFNSLKTVPSSFEWDELSDGLSYEKLSIPVIDFTDPNVEQLVCHAAETWGMFQITNHGIPSSLIDKVDSEARRLFNLPTQEKMKVLRPAGGSSGYGVVRMSPLFDKFMWHEGYTILGSTLDDAKKLWPHDHTTFSDVMDDYQNKVKGFAHQLMLKILKSLDVTEEEKKWAAPSPEESVGALQLNSYPRCPNPSRAMGLAPHTDTLLLTILNQSEISGLQIFGERDGWVTVPPVPGAVVVFIGDFLHIFSNGKFHSPLHRVIINENKHRISFAYFFGPRMDSRVATFANSQSPPLYRSMPVKEYLDIKAKHPNESLSMIKI